MFCIILCSHRVWNPSLNLNPRPAVENNHKGDPMHSKTLRQEICSVEPCMFSNIWEVKRRVSHCRFHPGCWRSIYWRSSRTVTRWSERSRRQIASVWRSTRSPRKRFSSSGEYNREPSCTSCKQFRPSLYVVLLARFCQRHLWSVCITIGIHSNHFETLRKTLQKRYM